MSQSHRSHSQSDTEPDEEPTYHRNVRAPVWQYYEPVPMTDKHGMQRDGAKCKICGFKTLITDKSTSPLLGHIENKHLEAWKLLSLAMRKKKEDLAKRKAEKSTYEAEAGIFTG
jgi:hypothetical protein